MSNIEDVDVDNISEEELYKLALSYFKDNEGKSFHIAYQEKWRTRFDHAAWIYEN